MRRCCVENTYAYFVNITFQNCMILLDLRSLSQVVESLSCGPSSCDSMQPATWVFTDVSNVQRQPKYRASILIGHEEAGGEHAWPHRRSGESKIVSKENASSV
jgi:hypothetical protein